MGIWGRMIRQWLDELLPDDAADRCRGRVSVSVTHVRGGLPPLQVWTSEGETASKTLGWLFYGGGVI